MHLRDLVVSVKDEAHALAIMEWKNQHLVQVSGGDHKSKMI